jgi:hypothetical protein
VRLTLRTLLAYLDDTLEPAQARTIGQKVAESEPARELIARIKQVTRRRRLLPPQLTDTSAKLDANTIAEYVDNVLPAEELAAVEEVCMASDVHLAEVAACHQILTLVLGEPMLVPPTARQRMYALRKGREATRQRSTAASGIGQGAVESPGSADDAELGLLGSSLVRPGSSLRWAVPLSAAVLLVGAALAIWMAMVNNPGTVSSNHPAQPETQPVAVVDASTKGKPADSQPEKKEQPVLKPIVQPEPKPGGTEAKNDGNAQVVNKPDELKQPKKEEKEAGPPKVLPPSAERRELGKYVQSTPGVLLQREPNKLGWQRIKPDSSITSTNYLVSLPGYHSELHLESGAHMVLWGKLPDVVHPRAFQNELVLRFLDSAVTLHVNPAFDVDFTLDHGSVALFNRKKEGAAKVRVRFLDEVWDVTLPDQNTQVVVELQGGCEPYEHDLVGGEPNFSFYFWNMKGEPMVRVRTQEFLVPSPRVVTWNTVSATREDIMPPRLPEWWTNKGPAKSAVQTALDGLARRLTAQDLIDVALAEMMKSGEPNNRMLAVICLGALGDLADVLDGVDNDRFPDVTSLARKTLIHYLGLNAKNDEKLLRALAAKNYAPAHAHTVMQLLHGFSQEQWEDPATRAAVADYLNHDKLLIRHLTYLLLMELEPGGATISYRPTADVGQRERGAEEWRRFLMGNRTPARPDNSKKKTP